MDDAGGAEAALRQEGRVHATLALEYTATALPEAPRIGGEFKSVVVPASPS